MQLLQHPAFLSVLCSVMESRCHKTFCYHYYHPFQGKRKDDTSLKKCHSFNANKKQIPDKTGYLSVSMITSFLHPGGLQPEQQQV